MLSFRVYPPQASGNTFSGTWVNDTNSGTTQGTRQEPHAPPAPAKAKAAAAVALEAFSSEVVDAEVDAMEAELELDGKKTSIAHKKVLQMKSKMAMLEARPAPKPRLGLCQPCTLKRRR